MMVEDVFPPLKKKIQRAREAGFTDQEILDGIYKYKIRPARELGYTPQEIIGWYHRPTWRKIAAATGVSIPAAIAKGVSGVLYKIETEKEKAETQAGELLYRARRALGLVDEKAPREEVIRQGKRLYAKELVDYWNEVVTLNTIPTERGTAKYYVQGIAQTVGTNIPFVIAGLINPLIALGGLGAQVFGTKYDELRRAGYSDREATGWALSEAAAEAAPELLPLKVLLKTTELGLKAFAKKAISYIGTEIPQEQVTTTLTSAIDKETINENMTWGEFLARLVDTGIITAASAGITGAAVIPFTQEAPRKRIDITLPEVTPPIPEPKPKPKPEPVPLPEPTPTPEPIPTPPTIEETPTPIAQPVIKDLTPTPPVVKEVPIKTVEPPPAEEPTTITDRSLTNYFKETLDQVAHYSARIMAGGGVIPYAEKYLNEDYYANVPIFLRGKRGMKLDEWASHFGMTENELIAILRGEEKFRRELRSGMYNEEIIPEYDEQFAMWGVPGRGRKAKRLLPPEPAPALPPEFTPRVAMPELVRIAKDLLGDAPIIGKLRKSLGYFYGGGMEGRIKLDWRIFANPTVTAQVLGHEIGHATDWLPDYTLKRGNILGRLKTLRDYIHSTVEDFPGGIEPFDPKERAKLRRRLRREVLAARGKTYKDLKKDPALRKEINKIIEERFKEEARQRGFILRDDVMNELKALSQFWNPFDENANPRYTEYRYSSKELYADALSVLLNQPNLLDTMAPIFARAFWDNIDAKPQAKDALERLNDLLTGDSKKIGEQRDKDMADAFRRGQDLRKAKIREEEIFKKGLWFQISDEIIDRNWAVIKRLNKFEKEGVKFNPDEDPRYLVEETNYLSGKIKQLVERFDAAIRGVDFDDLGKMLYLERVAAGERTTSMETVIEGKRVKIDMPIANPWGYTIDDATFQLRYLRELWGEEKYNEVKSAADGFRRVAHELLIEEAYAAGVLSTELYLQLKDKTHYATFNVLEYFKEVIPAKMYKQFGTFRDIENPVIPTISKCISTLRLIEKVKSANALVKVMTELAPNEIKPAEEVGWPRRIKEPPKGWGLIKTMEDGKVKGYYVDPWIAKSYEYIPVGVNNAILNILFKLPNKYWYRPVFITFNLGFQSFNFARDFQRRIKANPHKSLVLSAIEVGKSYMKALPHARARVAGVEDEIISYMEQNAMLGVTYNDILMGMDPEDSAYNLFLQKYGLEEPGFANRHKALKLPLSLLRAIKMMGDFIETLPKVSSYMEMKPIIESGKMPVRVAAYKVRNYAGSPNFLRRGGGYSWTNEVFLFSTAIKEGIRGDIEMATNPETRAGYWWKTIQLNIIPHILVILAEIGYFGEKLREMYEMISEYNKTNYNPVPLGYDRDGKLTFIRIPQDEAGRVVGGLTRKLIKSFMGDFSFRDIQEIMDYTAGQIPSPSPVLENLTTIGQFLTGGNPMDWFRKEPILSPDEAEVGAWKPMIRWTLRNNGLAWFTFFDTEERDQPLGTMVIECMPIVNRYIKVSDYGLMEKYRKYIIAPVKREEAEERLDRRQRINEAIRLYKQGNHIEALKLLQEDTVEKTLRNFKQYNKALGYKQSGVHIKVLIEAQTRRQKEAVRKEMFRRLPREEYEALMVLAYQMGWY